ncbi:MAG: FAD-dependent monooxygenase, partial [Gammaproteobacteria bacterium]|nr:FAD-dependent monooxygenase [Gammaproteobacteria bacterium]
RRLGRLAQPGHRAAYEISLQHVERQFRRRALLLGNSAHTLHPNAAQGFNLALRDVAGLAALLEQAARTAEDPGSDAVLERYQALRTPDQSRVLKFTDTLARLFYTDNPCLAASRNLGLMATELLPGVKQRLLHLGTGLDALDPVLA